MKKLCLRPYPGNLYLAKSRKDYEKSHLKLFKTSDVLDSTQCGRMSGGKDSKGMWTYLVWGQGVPQLAHEFSHVILDVFQSLSIDPREANGEPFCYLLGQMMLDAQPQKGRA